MSCQDTQTEHRIKKNTVKTNKKEGGRKALSCYCMVAVGIYFLSMTVFAVIIMTWTVEASDDTPLFGPLKFRSYHSPTISDVKDEIDRYSYILLVNFVLGNNIEDDQRQKNLDSIVEIENDNSNKIKSIFQTLKGKHLIDCGNIENAIETLEIARSLDPHNKYASHFLSLARELFSNTSNNQTSQPVWPLGFSYNLNDLNYKKIQPTLTASIKVYNRALTRSEQPILTILKPSINDNDHIRFYNDTGYQTIGSSQGGVHCDYPVNGIGITDASGDQTVLLSEGEARRIPSLLSASAQGAYELEVSCSNDNCGPTEVVNVYVDGTHVGDFNALDTGEWGHGWNKFVVESVNTTELEAGEHEVGVVVAGGDGMGIEVDYASMTPTDDDTDSAVAEHLHLVLEAEDPAATGDGQVKPRFKVQLPDLRMLAVGIDEYRDDTLFAPLDYAVSDARRVSNVFNQLGFKSDMLINKEATRLNLIETLAYETMISKPEDTFVLYVAAHGLSDLNKNKFIVTANRDLDGKNEIVSIAEIEQLLGTHKGDSIVILDSCFYGLETAIKNYKTRDTERNIINQPTIIFASSIDEKSIESPEHGGGLFTYALLEYLENSLSKNDEYAAMNIVGGIDPLKMFEYISDRVSMVAHSKFALNQTPSFKQGTEVSNYPID